MSQPMIMEDFANGEDLIRQTVDDKEFKFEIRPSSLVYYGKSEDIAAKVVEQMTPVVERLIVERDREKIIVDQRIVIENLKSHLLQVIGSGRRAFMTEPYTKEVFDFMQCYTRAETFVEGITHAK